MTRQEVCQEYDVTPLGCIVSPGQFEGEPVYAPALWSSCLEGFADKDDGEFYEISVLDEDRREFPELTFIASVTLWQRDDGFVCTAPISA